MRREHFAISAKLHVFARIPYRVFCRYMKINNKQANSPSAVDRKYFKKLIVLPIARRIKKHAEQGMKLGRRSFKKIEEVEKMVEIIARQIKRLSDQGE